MAIRLFISKFTCQDFGVFRLLIISDKHVYGGLKESYIQYDQEPKCTRTARTISAAYFCFNLYVILVRGQIHEQWLNQLLTRDWDPCQNQLLDHLQTQKLQMDVCIAIPIPKRHYKTNRYPNDISLSVCDSKSASDFTHPVKDLSNLYWCFTNW